MSGLAGRFRLGGSLPAAPVDRGALTRMLRPLDDRGPDARVEEVLPVGAIGLTVGAPGEPAAGIAWDATRRWCVVAEGELLNTRALLSELRAWEEEPAAESTAAIAATLFAARSFPAGLTRLTGDVSLLAWDSVEGKVWAARDRAGQRPLYWATLPDGELLVASEPRALLADPALDRTLDPAAVAEALAFGGPLPPRTAWRAVRALAPGELLWCAGGTPTVERWWEEEGNPAGADGARYRWARSAQFGTELAIQQRVAVEAPIAVALSGGAYAEALLAASAARRREPLLALTLAGTDDAAMARAEAAARRCRADHHVVRLTAQDALALLDESAAAGEPLLSPEGIGWRALARAASDRGARVLLTGVGGASLFGGPALPLFDRASALPGLGILGRAARAGASRISGAPALRRQLGRLLDLEDAPWDDLTALAAASPTPDATGTLLWLLRRLDAGAALAELDRACAAYGVRAQNPYADAPLTRLIASIPIGHLVQVRRPRGLFLDAMKERLADDPPEHAPMELAVADWLADGALLDAARRDLAALVPPGTLAHACAEDAPARRRWAMVALAAWYRALDR